MVCKLNRLVLGSDRSMVQIAKDLDISVGNLRRWIRVFRNRGTCDAMLGKDDAEELAFLRREKSLI